MSLQTEAMRQTDQRIITAGQKETGGLWYGLEMVNHPTPSGCERWLITYSDNRGYPTAEEAKQEFSKILHPPLDMKEKGEADGTEGS